MNQHLLTSWHSSMPTSQVDETDTVPSIPTADLLLSLDEYEDDIEGWLNHVLDERLSNSGGEEAEANLATLEQRISHLATRLQVVTQDTAAQLEQTIEDVSRTVPRITYDLQFMRESGLTLQVNLKSVESKTKRAENDPTNAALERLHYFSTVKSRMEGAREVLREAESWSVLEPEVTNLIATASFAKASERLAEASRSMVVFQNTPEFESRRALMISLQNQLEAAVSSPLVAAINAKDVSACRSYFSIFSNIQRETEFRNYYNGSRRADLVSFWQSVLLVDCDNAPSAPSASTPIPFAEFFRKFLADLLARVNEEQTSITAIFSDPQTSLSLFIQSTLDSLSPSLSQRLTDVSESHGDAALPELIKSFRVAEEFASSVEQIMSRMGYSSFFSQASDDSVTRRSGRRSSISSRRMGSKSTSMSPNVNVLASGPGVTWELALFESFIDLQTEYQPLETRFMNKELSRIVGPSVLQSSDVARVLQERSAAIFGAVEECLSRCIVFTHGYGAIGMVGAINQAFKTFLETSQRSLIPQTNGDNPSPIKSGLHHTSRVDSETLEELDYTPDDWSNFQLALHLLETCRVVKDRLLVFEAKVKASLVQVSTTFRLARNDPHGVHLGGIGATKGEAELLLQSSLNSAELHALLDALDPASASAPSPSFSVAASPAARLDASILAASLDGLSSFTKSCQLYLQHVILKPLHAHLSTYASAPAWSSTESKTERGAFDLQIPSFSLSPTQTVQHVAEGLLNLPRLFEVYGDDDALAFSIETLPFVNEESLKYMMHAENSQTGVPPSPTDDRPASHSRRASMTLSVPARRLSSTSLSLASNASAAELHQPPPASLSPEMVTSTWLHSLTLSLLTHLTSTILPSIPQLSSQGAAQLSSDLAYLSNIIRALNVEFEELDQWRDILDMKEGDARNRYDAILTETRLGGGGDIAGREIWEMFAKMRGWMPSTVQ
ncbi:Golgi complex component 7-domain-containing protein [Cantharellus anzutake]|uniref:Golgi complex component 7-domain-containing protein n=1 Tax=Cantharellus anzutake TaxID=1750568 RepID=UPI001907FCDF|nr:Golgi complex component 7-domain-containing protein [Cantharellus anzutake]KAF8328554.1 Golgi complex component 7-domain-containing protein [Cantharellus anzutake]